MKKHTFISENLKTLKDLHEKGVNLTSDLKKYEAYQLFLKQCDTIPIMKRYEIVAKKLYGNKGKASTIRSWISSLKEDVDC